MERYANIGGDSNVSGYSFASDSITVFFMDGSAYLYSNGSAGAGNVATMKRLAESGHGLNSFIMHNVRDNYARKWRVSRY